MLTVWTAKYNLETLDSWVLQSSLREASEFKGKKWFKDNRMEEESKKDHDDYEVMILSRIRKQGWEPKLIPPQCL